MSIKSGRVSRLLWDTGAGFIIISFVLVGGFAWLFASQEAASYRKFCDRDVTTWDALWLDLRIDECEPRDEVE